VQAFTEEQMMNELSQRKATQASSRLRFDKSAQPAAIY
jgi:hypothetical protein